MCKKYRSKSYKTNLQKIILTILLKFSGLTRQNSISLGVSVSICLMVFAVEQGNLVLEETVTSEQS